MPEMRNVAKAVGDSKALGYNDLVQQLAAGTDVERKAAGGPFLGINHSFGVASTATTHLISILTSATVLDAQTDLSLVTADQFLNADVMADVAPNSDTNISNQEIDSTTEANTSTLDMRLIRLAPYIGNASGTNAVFFCLCNDIAWSDLKAGI